MTRARSLTEPGGAGQPSAGEVSTEEGRSGESAGGSPEILSTPASPQMLSLVKGREGTSSARKAEETLFRKLSDTKLMSKLTAESLAAGQKENAYHSLLRSESLRTSIL